jgi:PAS domain S-box-containing protein
MMNLQDIKDNLSILDSITDPLAIYDRDFRIIQANAAFCSTYQLSVAQIQGKPCYEVMYHRQEICVDCHVQETFTSGERRSREKLILLPNGDSRIFEVSSFPVRDHCGEVIQAIEHGRDITKRKNLELQLVTSEERYRTIVEMAREGIFILDANAKITFANSFLIKLLGFEKEKIIGKTLCDFLDDETRLLGKAQFAQNRQGVAQVEELRLTRKDGCHISSLISITPLIVNSIFMGSIGIITDINKLKKVENELRSSHEFKENIFNAITDNLVVINPLTYQIVELNDSFRSRVGLEISAIVGKPCYEIMLGKSVPCEIEGSPCPLQETVRTKRAARGEKIYPDAQGNPRVLHIATYPLLKFRS